MNLHVKCPIFSAKDNEDTESHLLCCNDWMNSQGIVQDTKCGSIIKVFLKNRITWAITSAF